MFVMNFVGNVWTRQETIVQYVTTESGDVTATLVVTTQIGRSRDLETSFPQSHNLSLAPLTRFSKQTSPVVAAVNNGKKNSTKYFH
jgi:hypothetical protein